MRSKFRLIALLVALVSVLGCGSDDSAEQAQEPQEESSAAALEATPAGPTKDQFIEQADEVCADFREATKEASDSSPSDYDELAEQAQKIIDESQTTLGEFRALAIPEEDQEIIRQYTSSIEESMTLFKRLKAAAENADASKIQTYTDDLAGLTQRQRGLAQGYGFKVCGAEG